MQLREGYKQTDVGVIPQEWAVRPLLESATIRSGIAKNSNVVVSDPITVHYLRVANVQDGFLDLSEMSQIQVSRADLKRFAVLPGDVLMNEGGDLDKLGRGAMWRGEFNPCIHQNHVFVVRCNPSLLPEYLDVWTGTRAARRYFLLAGKQTTNLASINKTALGQLPVALPLPAEQRAIATALADVDALLAKIDQLIAKKRDLKQAAMQQLLTGQTRLPGFSGEWEVKRLGDLFAFSGGHTASRDQLSSSGYCYLHYGDIHKSTKTFIDLEAEFLDIQKLAVRLSDVTPSAILRDGDVVFVDASEDDEGTSRHVVVVNPLDKPYISGLHTIVSKAKGDLLDNGFKRFCFQTKSIKQQFQFFAVGTKVIGISKTSIAKIELRFPPMAEQTAIATILSDMDTELSALEARRDKTRALKQGMMQALLTGRIRLVGAN
jgi:type I restriction enzyme S subunit